MASSQEQGFEKHHYLIVILNIATPSQVALVVKTPPASVGDIRDMVQSLGQEDPLEERTRHSSTLAGRIPWTVMPGGLQSIESQRVRHD